MDWFYFTSVTNMEAQWEQKKEKFTIVTCSTRFVHLNSSLTSLRWMGYFLTNNLDIIISELNLRMNISNISLLEDYSETDFNDEFNPFDKNYWALLLLVLCISCVFGNVLVILSVARERYHEMKTFQFFFIS